MRRAREISNEEENPTVEQIDRHIYTVRTNPVEPEPVGTIILKAFRITGYQSDCDGSLMAEIENIDSQGEPTGWTENAIGLYSSSTLVVSEDELKEMFNRSDRHDVR